MRQHKVLIFSYCTFGDSLVLIPSLKALRSRFSSSELFFLSDAYSHLLSAKAILEPLKLIDSFISIRIEGPKWKIWVNRIFIYFKIRFLIRPKIAIILIPPHPPMTGLFLEKMILRLKQYGIKKIYSPDPQEFLAKYESQKASPHVIDSLQELCLTVFNEESVGDNPTLPTVNLFEYPHFPSLKLPNSEKIRIAITITSNMPSKMWPIERYQELIQLLNIQFRDQIHFVFIGANSDLPLIQRCSSQLSEKSIIIGKSIPQVAETLRSCCFYLGNDTGVMHLAAAVGLKCVAIFSARDFEQAWYPYGTGHYIFRTNPVCSKCMLHECTDKNLQCLTEISVKEVKEVCVEWLNTQLTLLKQ